MAWLFSARRVLVALAMVLASAAAISQSPTLSSYSIGTENSFNGGTGWEDASSSNPLTVLNETTSAKILDEGSLPAAPEPAGVGAGGYNHYEARPAAFWHQRPISRVGFGADVSLLGIGLKSALELNQNFDLRVLGNVFSHPNTAFKVDGVGGTADLHFASASASLDWYPFANGGVFRISPGVMFLNQNAISVVGGVNPGTGFKLASTTYYSASPNPATGATPITGSGGINLHHNSPAFMATAGFGSFVPRSKRHWSFPSEFGVIFTGSPVVSLHASGWACLDQAQTQCTNIGDLTNAIAVEFNQSLASHIQHWQAQLNKVSIYPVFSYSVMYSFYIPGRRP